MFMQQRIVSYKVINDFITNDVTKECLAMRKSMIMQQMIFSYKEINDYVTNDG